MQCPHGCPEAISADRLADHVFYLHGAPACACGCGDSTPSPGARFALPICARRSRRARKVAERALAEFKSDATSSAPSR